MLISFEGIDGSGKTTQISLLKTKIESIGKSVAVFREPGGTELSEQIRSILLDTSMEIHPVSEMLLFSAARSQLIATKVIPTLKDGIVVILDRFYDSTVAYQGYGRSCLPLDKIHSINAVAAHGLVPSLTFYLRVSVELSRQRLKHQLADRMEQSGEKFYQDVIYGFDSISRREPRYRTVDASDSIEQIHQTIWEQTLPLLQL
ncbi:MAG: dTMP kinase [Bacteroidetes bacterium]|nr:dTMP kinase [Bacteroidota bacterium]